MKKLKIDLKKICIYLLLVFACIFVFCGFGLKTNAAQTIYRVNVDNQRCYIYFTTQDMPLAIGSGSTNLITEPETNLIINLQYDSSNNYYIVNNNNQHILQNNSLFCVCFENEINHFIFYQISYTSNSSVRDNYSIRELFTIGGSTQTITYFNFFSQVLQFRLDNSTRFTDNQIIDNYFTRFNGGYFGSLSRQERQRGFNQGYNNGYTDGQAGETAISPFFNVLSGIFTSIGAIFSIELVPHVPIGLFFLVPLFFAIVGLILFIWRKNF